MGNPATHPQSSDPQSPPRPALTWGGKLGAASGTAWRLLRGRPGRNRRLLGGMQAGLRGFAGPLRHLLSVLFLQATGVVFLLLALSLGFASLHEYHRYRMQEEDWQRAALAGVLGLMFLYFAVTSFWRARRKRTKE